MKKIKKTQNFALSVCVFLVLSFCNLEFFGNCFLEFGAYLKFMKNKNFSKFLVVLAIVTIVVVPVFAFALDFSKTLIPCGWVGARDNLGFQWQSYFVGAE